MKFGGLKSLSIIITVDGVCVLYLGSLHTDVADSNRCGEDKGGCQEKAQQGKETKFKAYTSLRSIILKHLNYCGHTMSYVYMYNRNRFG